MSFTSGIPADGQSLDSSRVQVRNNFSNYFNTLGINHGKPNTSISGKHTFVEMPQQGTIGGMGLPVTLAGEGGLYTAKFSTDTSNSSLLFYQRDNATSINQPVLPIATGSFNTGPNPPNAGDPPVFVMQYNLASVVRNSKGTYTITMSITVPFTIGVAEFAVIPSITAPIPSGTLIGVYPGAYTSNSFVINLFNNNGSAIDVLNARIAFTVIM